MPLAAWFFIVTFWVTGWESISSHLDRAVREKVKAYLQTDGLQEHGIPAAGLVDFLRYRESLRS